MLITIRPELHERFPYDHIPSSDYDIERDEMATVGAKKTWPDLASKQRQLPSAIYITETATVQECRDALTRVKERTGRKMTAVITTGDVYFHNLDEVPQPIPFLTGWESAAYGTLPGLSPSFYEEIFGGRDEKKPTAASSWIDAIIGSSGTR
jgi:hypothetical protein